MSFDKENAGFGIALIEFNWPKIILLKPIHFMAVGTVLSRKHLGS